MDDAGSGGGSSTPPVAGHEGQESADAPGLARTDAFDDLAKHVVRNFRCLGLANVTIACWLTDGAPFHQLVAECTPPMAAGSVHPMLGPMLRKHLEARYPAALATRVTCRDGVVRPVAGLSDEILPPDDHYELHAPRGLCLDAAVLAASYGCQYEDILLWGLLRTGEDDDWNDGLTYTPPYQADAIRRHCQQAPGSSGVWPDRTSPSYPELCDYLTEQEGVPVRLVIVRHACVEAMEQRACYSKEEGRVHTVPTKVAYLFSSAAAEDLALTAHSC